MSKPFGTSQTLQSGSESWTVDLYSGPREIEQCGGGAVQGVAKILNHMIQGRFIQIELRTTIDQLESKILL